MPMIKIDPKIIENAIKECHEWRGVTSCKECIECRNPALKHKTGE